MPRDLLNMPGIPTNQAQQGGHGEQRKDLDIFKQDLL